MKKTEIYVKVKDKKQAKQYKAVLKALGENIHPDYWIDGYTGEQNKLAFKGRDWVVLVGGAYNRTEVTIKQLIKMLVCEETELPKYV